MHSFSICEICFRYFGLLCTYIFNLGNTCEKLQMAAQVIVAIENPLDIIVQSAMPYGQRAVLKLALELMPLLEGTILTIKEGALGKIRIIAFRDRLSHEMCGTIRLAHKWEVVVDLLLYRELEEAKPEDEDEVGQTLDYLLLNMVGETNGPLL
ncbi:unnamed protein product [Brassica oleracea var. botrytis]|uniref:Uncharacterized protein n=2 Tax=Brassica oleracea TaxID=3712 RepID=A0A0D3ART4_BRAOL|nr:unnamed protein product [Brassica oleracea]